MKGPPIYNLWFQSVILGLVVSSSASGASTCLNSPTSFQCVDYIRNYDADTLTVEIKDVHPILGKSINVRIKGIDAPEIRSKDQCEKNKARNAKKLLQNILKNAKRIDLINIERDKYFRLLADVIVDGKNVKEVLIKNRVVRTYYGKKKSKSKWNCLN